jgi:CubicO group peptidase (beta-lactamase class C family)
LSAQINIQPNTQLSKKLREWMTEFPELCTHAYFGFGRAGKSQQAYWQSSEDPQKEHGSSSDLSLDLNFDIASLTKALVTTPLVLKHFSGSLDEPVASLFGGNKPKWASAEAWSKVSLRRLLQHQSGLPAWANFWIKQIDDDGSSRLKTTELAADHIDQVIDRQAIQAYDGPKNQYSDIGFLCLQRILECTRAKTMRELWLEFCEEHPEFAALVSGSSDHFLKNSIPTAACRLRGREVCGETHDENAFALGGFCGHAGAFAKGPDVLNLLQTLAQKKDGLGLLDRVNSSEASSSAEFALGWQRSTSEYSKAFGAGKALGHLGFTGSCFWIEPDTQSYFVLLTNRTIHKRLDPRIQELRKIAGAHAWQSLQAL